MRTTLAIDDDALLVIRQYAEERAVSLGQAVSDLVHLGATHRPQFKTRNGWALLESPAGALPVTNELLDGLEREDSDEEWKRALSPRR